MKRFVYIERLVPAVGLIRNAEIPEVCIAGWPVRNFEGPGELKYGANVRIGEGTRLDLPKDSVLEIGDDVSVSRFAHIVPGSSGHIFFIVKWTTIQDGCRIYGNVTIGPRCIFGAERICLVWSACF